MAKIENRNSNTIISGTSGNDSIYNGSGGEIYGFRTGSNVTINGGEGNDYIFTNSGGTNILINGGDGNDTVYNFYCHEITINGGYDNDSIATFTEAEINGDAGNDTLVCEEFDCTAKGGADSDVFVYRNSNGVDKSYANFFITDYAEEDIVLIETTNISDISTTRSGNVVFQLVGNGSIILENASDKVISYIDNKGINCTYEATSWKLKGTTATYGTSTNPLITVSGVKSLDGITLSGNTVTIANSSLNKSNVTISNGYTLKLAADVTAPQTTAGSWSISGYTATYKGSSTTAGYQLVNNAIIYTASGGGTNLVTVDGVKSTSGLSLSGNVVTVANAALNQSAVTISDGYTLALATSVDTIKETLAGGWTTLSSGNVAYLAGGTGSYYSLSGDGKSITYNASIAGNDNIVELRGVKGTPTLSGTNVSLAADNFASDVSVVSNAGDYSFYLKGDLKGKKFTGGAGNDDIENWGDSVSIDGGKGDDSINNLDAASVTINGGDGNDLILNIGSSVTMDGGAGSDIIQNLYGDNAIINGGGGNDVLRNYSPNASINGDAGNDHIYNEGSNVIIDGGAGDDGVVNYGNETSIVGGTGNDTICNNGYIEDDGSFYHYDDSLGYAENVLFKYSSGDGNDIIYGFKESSTLSISGGEFSSVKSGDDIIVTVGDGKISLMGAASLSTVNIAGTVKKSFTLSEGNDTYCNTLADATIQALGGNDSIYNCGGKRVSISGGNGDDTIYNTYASRQSGSPLLPDPVLLDDDYVTSESISSSSTDTVSDEDYSPDNATLLGGAGKDVIYNIGANVLIEGGTGNDAISLSSDAQNNLIQYSSGDGNDTIWGFRADSTLQIGDGSGTYAPTQKSGNDIIVTVGDSKITLVDAAKLSKVNIKGIKKEAALMASNKIANTVVAGTAENDEIINRAKNSTILGGGGDDTLTNMRKNNVKLSGDDGDDVLENSDGSNVTIEGGAGNDDIYSDGDDVSIDGGDGDDSIYVKAATDVTIKGGTGNDDITLKAASNTLIQYAEGDGNDLIQGFNETTTLQIGNGTTDTYFGKTSGSDVIITVGDEQITLKGAGDFETVKERIAGTFVDKTLTVTVKAVTLSGAYANYEIADASKRTAATRIVGNAKDNSILGGSNKDSLYGEAGDDSINGNAGADKLYGGDGSDTIDGGAGNDAIYGEADDDSLSGGAGSDYLNGGDGDDTLDGGAGTNTLAGGNGADTFIYSGGKDVISDYVSGEDIISLGTTFSDSITYAFSGNDVVFTVGTGKLTIKNAKGKTLSFIDSEDTLLEMIPGVEIFDNDSPATNPLKTNTIFADATTRTKAIKINGNTLDNTIVGGSKNDTLYGEAGDDSLVGNAGNDKLYGGDGSDTIDGGAGNDAIYGQADDDSLSGGAGSDYLNGGDGDDTLDGGTGTNTLAGGNGADTFIYSGGKDVISDYTAGEDVISISAATFADITKATVSDSDVVLTFGATNKTLTIKKARYIPVTLVDSTGADTIIGPIPLDNDTESPYTLKDSVTAVDATARELPIQITGNDLSNTITGGTGNDTLLGANGTDSLYGNAGSDSLDGGNGDDTIWGGKGNDSLTGGNGDDVFIYTGGKDVITDYAEGDKISIGAAFSKATLSGNNVVFTVSNQNKLTVKDAKYKEMLYIDKDGTEHVTMFGGVIYDDDSDSAVTLGVAVDVGSAKNRTFAIQITGNEWNNTILGGAGADTLYGLDGYDSLLGADGDDKLYGGKGDDTLIGGKGNDTLWGDNGSDTFVYNAGDGKDVIMSFDEDDKLELNGVNIGDITASIKSSALVLSIDNSNSITFKSYDGPLNINGEFYEYKSGNRLVKQQ